MKKTKKLLIFVLLLLISFVCLNLGISLLWGSKKLDLTSDKRYTLTTKTQELASQLNSPIAIKLYVSKNLREEHLLLGKYAEFVLKTLEEYRNFSNGKIKLEVKNPEPYSLLEKEATNNKIQPFLDKSGQNNLYFGAVISDDTGNSQTIPYFNPERQNYLENDLSRILSKFQGYQKKNIGVVSNTLNTIGSQRSFDKTTDWNFITLLKNDYNVRKVDYTIAEVPYDVDVLLLINPQELSEKFLYALDQYLMRGGKLLVLLDPFSEVFLLKNKFINPKPSNISAFLERYGIKYQDEIIIGDKSLSQQMLIKGEEGDERLMDYPLWLKLGQQNINQQNIITQGLQSLEFKTAGHLEEADEALYDAVFTALAQTGNNAGIFSSELASKSNQEDVINLYSETGEQYNLAVLVEGSFRSFFDGNKLWGTEVAQKMLPFMIYSLEPTQIVVVADSDVFADSNLNISSQRDFHNFIHTNNNADFILRIVDYLAENQNLLNIGSKNLNIQKQNILEAMQKKVFEKYATQHSKIKKALQENKEKENDLLSKIRRQEVNPSIAVLKQMENYQKNNIDFQNELKKIDYTIKEDNKKQRNMSIILNTIIFPFALILLIYLVNFLLNFWKKRMIKNA